jgi:hypothetical protein
MHNYFDKRLRSLECSTFNENVNRPVSVVIVDPHKGDVAETKIAEATCEHGLSDDDDAFIIVHRIVTPQTNRSEASAP